jgi:hypothetical protein
MSGPTLKPELTRYEAKVVSNRRWCPLLPAKRKFFAEFQRVILELQKLLYRLHTHRYSFTEEFMEHECSLNSPKTDKMSLQMYGCFVKKCLHCIINFVLFIIMPITCMFIQILHHNLSRYSFPLYYTLFCKRILGALKWCGFLNYWIGSTIRGINFNVGLK